MGITRSGIHLNGAFVLLSEFLPEPEQSSSVTPSVLGVQTKGQKFKKCIKRRQGLRSSERSSLLSQLLTPKVLQMNSVQVQTKGQKCLRATQSVQEA